MKVPELIWRVIRGQLFARISTEYEDRFHTHLYFINIGRFAVQSFVLVIMDLCSLLFYLLDYLKLGVFNMPHIYVHLIKIVLMGIAVLYFSRWHDKGYKKNSFQDRNIEVIYPLLHLLCEFALFHSGPQDLGALVRFLAVPFIVGGIAVIRQRESTLLLTIACIATSVYLYLFSPYKPFASLYGYIWNMWGVVYVCTLLMSFTVYSWFVNTFTANLRAETAKNEMQGLNRQLSVISRHDPLTGLLNRRGFQQSIDTAWGAPRNKQGSASVIMLDIDYFKLYNDRYGHLAGDDCLVRVAKAIQQVLPPDILELARYGGEEFIIAGFAQPHENMVQLANKIRLKVAGLRIENMDSDVAPYLTVSLGIASQTIEKLAHCDQLISLADECLYFAKRLGRNQVIHRSYEDTGYHDVYGNKVDLAGVDSFHDAYMRNAFKDMSVDSTYIYNGREKLLTFSKYAAEAYRLPGQIKVPSAKEAVELVPIVERDRPAFAQALKKAIEDKTSFFSMDVQLKLPDGREGLVSMRSNILYDENGAVEFIHGSMLSVDKMLQYGNTGARQAQSNSITLLPNRQKLAADLQSLISADECSGHLIFMDIKNFREINGVHGHVFGDKLLGEVALQLTKLADRAQDVYHYGVDQFIILEHEKGREHVEKMMDRVHDHFAWNRVCVEGVEIAVGFNIVAVGYTCDRAIEPLLVDLDIALQVAKYAKQRPNMFFTDQDRERFLSKFYLGKELEEAVQENIDSFLVMFQPIIDIKSKTCIGAEALLRWRDKEGDIKPPGIVVPILEQSRLMPRVEKWLFEQVCLHCSTWIKDGAPEDFFININLSPLFLTRETLGEEIHEAVKRHGLQKKNITLEIPETASIIEMKNTIGTLKTLRDAGYRIAIDDFGSGYSSLSYLSSLPVDEIKIDRSFVMNIDESDTSKEFLNAIVMLAKSMNYVVCVEGIETPTQSEFLHQSDADYLQGFYFGRPTQADKFFDAFLGT